MSELRHRQRGFTLVEVLVSVGILSVVASTIGMTLVRSLGTEEKVVNAGLAAYELRKGLGWFAGDVKMAKTTDLVDGAPPVALVTLGWTDQFQGIGTPHTAFYALQNDSLVRTYDGASQTVARRVTSVAFSRSGQTISVQITVRAEHGATRLLSLKTVMKPSI